MKSTFEWKNDIENKVAIGREKQRIRLVRLRAATAVSLAVLVCVVVTGLSKLPYTDPIGTPAAQSTNKSTPYSPDASESLNTTDAKATGAAILTSGNYEPTEPHSTVSKDTSKIPTVTTEIPGWQETFASVIGPITTAAFNTGDPYAVIDASYIGRFVGFKQQPTRPISDDAIMSFTGKYADRLSEFNNYLGISLDSPMAFEFVTGLDSTKVTDSYTLIKNTDGSICSLTLDAYAYQSENVNYHLSIVKGDEFETAVVSKDNYSCTIGKASAVFLSTPKNASTGLSATAVFELCFPGEGEDNAEYPLKVRFIGFNVDLSDFIRDSLTLSKMLGLDFGEETYREQTPSTDINNQPSLTIY